MLYQMVHFLIQLSYQLLLHMVVVELKVVVWLVFLVYHYYLDSCKQNHYQNQIFFRLFQIHYCQYLYLLLPLVHEMLLDHFKESGITLTFNPLALRVKLGVISVNKSINPPIIIRTDIIVIPV